MISVAGSHPPGSSQAPASLYLPSGATLVAALGGCARYGLVAVPLDLNEPAQRRREIIADACCACVLTDGLHASAARDLSRAISMLDAADPAPDRRDRARSRSRA